jgi:hypothetical protein
MTDPTHPPCDEIITLREKVTQLERREVTRDADIQRLLALASKIELLMSLSIGGGGLSLLTLVVTIVTILTTGK